MTRLDRTRTIRPATGSTLTAKNWLTEAALRRLADTEGVRASLPLGTTVEDTDTVESIRATLQTALAEVPAEEVRAALAAIARSSMRAAPVSVFDSLPVEEVQA